MNTADIAKLALDRMSTPWFQLGITEEKMRKMTREEYYACTRWLRCTRRAVLKALNSSVGRYSL